VFKCFVEIVLVEEDETGNEPERGVVSDGGIREPFLEAGDGGVL